MIGFPTNIWTRSLIKTTVRAALLQIFGTQLQSNEQKVAVYVS